MTQPAAGGGGRPSSSRSVVEVAVAQLLVDPLADARHVLLAEEQRLLHGEPAAVLTERQTNSHHVKG